MSDQQNNGGGAPFSDAQIDAIKGIVNPLINGLAASQKKLLEQQIGRSGDTLKGDIAKLLDEKFAGLNSAGETDDGKGGKAKKGDAVLNATMQKRMEEMGQSLEQMRQERDAERSKNRNAALKDAVANALSGHGIDGNRFRGAFAMLQQDGRIRYSSDDGDALVFVDDSGSEVDLAVGLKSWAKTDDAKLFLPPSGARGSGSRPGYQTSNNGQPASREQVTTNVGNYIARALQAGGSIEED